MEVANRGINYRIIAAKTNKIYARGTIQDYGSDLQINDNLDVYGEQCQLARYDIISIGIANKVTL